MQVMSFFNCLYLFIFLPARSLREKKRGLLSFTPSPQLVDNQFNFQSPSPPCGGPEMIIIFKLCFFLYQFPLRVAGKFPAGCNSPGDRRRAERPANFPDFSLPSSPSPLGGSRRGLLPSYPPLWEGAGGGLYFL